MAADALETRLKALEEQVKTLKSQVRKLNDIEAINRLQRAYGYYVEHMMGKEIIDCFSTSDDVYLEWLEGRYNGQAGLHRYFDKMRDTFSHELLHQVIQVSGIVTVAQDGLTAKGRCNDPRYPSRYIFPFHFVHPVTGKETSEAKRNTTVDWSKHRLTWRK